VQESISSVSAQFKVLAGTQGLAVLASPVASNEDLLASLAFARDALGIRSVYVGGRAEGKADHLLMTADKNPNRRGLEWIARGLDLALLPFSELTAAITSGKVKALYAIGGEVPVDIAQAAQTFSRLEYFVLRPPNALPLSPHPLPPRRVEPRGVPSQPGRHHSALPGATAVPTCGPGGGRSAAPTSAFPGSSGRARRLPGGHQGPRRPPSAGRARARRR
jgi:hypothetical protein